MRSFEVGDLVYIIGGEHTGFSGIISDLLDRECVINETYNDFIFEVKYSDLEH